MLYARNDYRQTEICEHMRGTIGNIENDGAEVELRLLGRACGARKRLPGRAADRGAITRVSDILIPARGERMNEETN